MRPLIPVILALLAAFLFYHRPSIPSGESAHGVEDQQIEQTTLPAPSASWVDSLPFQDSPSAENGQPDRILPPLDHQALVEKARKLEKDGRYLFAVARDTEMAPHLGGRWQIDGDKARWQYHLQSTGAHSLNLAFSEFHLPPTATLTLSDPSGQAKPVTFTARDNEEHGELWTPIFETDELLVTLDTPVSVTSDLRLRLFKTNHGFRSKKPRKGLKAIGDANSGRCNIDVACTAADDPTFGPLIDLYRDQIRSVAAFTLGGVEACSGALINNTRNDLTPYFLTSNHCGINSANAPSVVVYWNFENSTCRPPNTSTSGANGDGPVDQFNSGSIFRAANSDTDFCLIELDDPVDSSFNPFFAGWDRTGENSEIAVGIHHPGVAEKRISFELDPITTTNYYSETSVPDGTHFRVSDWNFGTTEGGSSGSPLFDDSGKIIGQLSGGEANCGNDLSDWYGRFSRSWANSNNPASRLSDWLDPDDTGALTLEGINSEVIISVGEAMTMEGDTSTTEIEVSLSLSEPVDETVSATLSTLEATADSNDFVAISQRIIFPPNQTTQTVTLSVNGDTAPEENETFLLLLSDPENGSVSISPGRVTILNDDFITPEINSPATGLAIANSPFEYRLTARNTPTSFSLSGAPEGMTIDPQTGVVSWTPVTTGTESVTLIATNPAGSDSQTLVITVESNGLAIALDLGGEPIISNALPGWSLQTDTTFDMVDAAQATPIGDGQNASFTIEITGPDLLEFRYKVSSEFGFDFLTVSLDGEEQLSFSGDIDWEISSLPISEGPHTVTFRYEKDGTLSEGADTAWLDTFVLASATGQPAITSPSIVSADPGSDFSYLIESITPDARFSTSELPEGLEFDGDRTISGQIAESGDYFFGIIATANGQEDRLPVLLRVAASVGEAVELDNLVWTREGANLWFGQSEETFDGIDAAQSGEITDLQSSTMSITVTGPDRLSFQWKVSSEEGFDALYFLLDGEPYAPVSPISGELDWTTVNVAIPSGTHELSWQYAKDGTQSSGQDAGWVDDLRLASGGRPIIWSETQPVLIAGITSRTSLDLINTESYDFQNLPPWLTYNESTEELVGTPPEAGNIEFTVSATGNGETTTRTLNFSSQSRSPLLEEALGQPNLAVTTTGPVPWLIVPDPRSTRSGPIGNNRSSSMTLTLQGPGSLRFRWRVSSEQPYDNLRYTLNGTFMSVISGEVDWEEIEVPLQPGRNQITWIYEKDGSTSDGEDLGQVADITLSGYAQFLTEAGVDHYSTSPFDDPEGNGLSLFHEYAFLIDPGSSDPAGFLQLNPLSDRTDLEFEGLLPSSGVEYFIESTTDLSAPLWSRIDREAEIIPTGSGTARYLLTVPRPAGRTLEFFRVRALFR